MDIVPQRPRNIEDALAITRAAKPSHVLILWTCDTEDGEGEAINILSACAEPGETLSEAEVVYLCEKAKFATLGGMDCTGPVRVEKK